VLAGVGLHRRGGTTVGVALTQHRVHRAALHLVVAAADVAVGVGGGLVGVIGQGVALGLQFLDGGLQLRQRSADVGQLDDVRRRLQRELTQLGQRIGDSLGLGEPIGKLGEDAAGERDVAGLDLDPAHPGVGLDDREERVGGQQRGLVGVRVDDLRHCRLSSNLYRTCMTLVASGVGPANRRGRLVSAP
jgi:hypothetical protein